MVDKKGGMFAVNGEKMISFLRNVPYKLDIYKEKKVFVIKAVFGKQIFIFE